MKSKVDKRDVDKLLPAPVDLSKLRDVVKIDVVRKTLNGVKCEISNIANLFTKNAIDNEMLSVSNLVKMTDYNTKINEIKKKIQRK